MDGNRKAFRSAYSTSVRTLESERIHWDIHLNSVLLYVDGEHDY